MALSYIEFTAPGGRTTYPLGDLEYLDIAHLSASVNGTPVAATFDDFRREFTLSAAPAAGDTVRVSRATPRGDTDRETDFLAIADGTAGLFDDLLNTDSRQTLFILGEGRDMSASLGDGPGMGLNGGGEWDAESLKITTLADGVDANDIATKSQLDALSIAGGLPSVTAGDNDSSLWVVSGAWAVRTPVQARAHLGLGTAALLDFGTAANELAIFDGDAKYPAVDGSLIDLSANPSILDKARATVVSVLKDGQPGNGANPTVATWSQALNTRIVFNGTPWANRVELNNSGDLDGSSGSPNHFALAAGTWRIRWVFRCRQTGASGSNIGFRITDNDDTASQTIYVDYGVHRLIRQYNAGQPYYATFLDELIMTSGSAFDLVFRWATTLTSANNDCTLQVFFHRIA